MRLLVVVLWLSMGLGTAWSADLRVRPSVRTVRSVDLCPHSNVVWKGRWRQSQPLPGSKVTGVGF